MKNKIEDLVKNYKKRELLMTTLIVELNRKGKEAHKTDLIIAKNTRLFWKIVIKDLEDLCRKVP